MGNMEYFITPATVKIPKIIYGTAWKKDKTADLVVKAVKAGFRGIDTACQPKHYNEPQVGEALQALKKAGIERESLFLQTKFTALGGQDPNNIPYDKNAPLEAQVAQSFTTSKKNLHTDYLDSLVLHSPMNTQALTMKVWQAMEKIHREGGARQLGISNCYNLNLLKELYNNAGIKPAVVQNRFYNDSGYDRELRSWCSDQGIIYQSFWTLTANPHILAAKELKEIARRHDKSTTQILFRFLTRIGVAPLTGTSSEKHMAEDLSIFEFDLSDQDIAIINNLFQ
jgi:diketogulonate reductase-like aldo/keto reductase